MTRTVFSNEQCVHVWAQQSQPHGRGGGSISFDGPTLYSYAAPIAKFVPDKDGVMVALLSTYKHSVTTSAHQWRAAHAVSHLPHYSVPCLPYNDHDLATHSTNVAEILRTYKNMLENARRKRTLSGDYEEREATRLALAAQEYAERFAVPVPVEEPWPDVEADWNDVLAHRAKRDARNNTPAAIAKREGAMRARIALAFLAERDAEAAWRQGHNGRRVHRTSTALLRVRGSRVETSWGATFPVEDARRVWPLLKRLHDAGLRLLGPAGIHLGHFQIDAMDQDGTIRAGCHTVKWQEVEGIARALKLIED